MCISTIPSVRVCVCVCVDVSPAIRTLSSLFVCVARHFILSRFRLHGARRWVGWSVGRLIGAFALFRSVQCFYIRTPYQFNSCMCICIYVVYIYCVVCVRVSLCVEFTSTSSSVHSFMTLAFIYLLWYSGWVCCFFLSLYILNCCSVCFSRVCCDLAT